MEEAVTIRVTAPVLSSQDVSELLNLNVRTVLDMARDGRLPAHRLPGTRKVQFLAAEVLEAVACASFGEGNGDQPGRPPAVAPGSTTTDVDPCDVWGAAPASSGEERTGRCLDHWVQMAKRAGLSPIEVSSKHLDEGAGPGLIGAVDIDGLVYQVKVGPRQRIRYVDDDGEVRWGLIDAVWVEPSASGDSSAPG